MVLNAPGAGQLEAVERPVPHASPGQLLIHVRACGVCRTDLHVVDGDLPDVPIPIVPGHEIVGVVDAMGEGVSDFARGDRIGIPWLGYTCGTCRYCRTDRENLCPNARFTGYQIDGGYAEYVVADARYAFKIPDAYDDIHAAPLHGWAAYGQGLRPIRRRSRWMRRSFSRRSDASFRKRCPAWKLAVAWSAPAST